MRHRELRRGLARRVEQADRVAVHQVERAHCLVVGGDGRLGRAGQAMPLGVLVHGYCAALASDASRVGRKRSSTWPGPLSSRA